MEEISWKKHMLIPVVIFVVAITVQSMGLITLFGNIPGYESIPHLDAIAAWLNFVGMLILVLLGVTAWGLVEELEIFILLKTRLTIDFVVFIIGVILLFVGGSPLLSISGVVCVLIALGDVVFFAMSLPSSHRRM